MMSRTVDNVLIVPDGERGQGRFFKVSAAKSVVIKRPPVEEPEELHGQTKSHRGRRQEK